MIRLDFKQKNIMFISNIKSNHFGPRIKELKSKEFLVRYRRTEVLNKSCNIPAAILKLTFIIGLLKLVSVILTALVFFCNCLSFCYKTFRLTVTYQKQLIKEWF